MMRGSGLRLAALLAACSSIDSSALLAQSRGEGLSEQSALPVAEETDEGHARKIALVLRGETFAAGRPGDLRFIDDARYVQTQLKNWESMLKYVISPFEQSGYIVDIITVTYKNPFNMKMRSVFGDRLKVLTETEELGTQADNAVMNFEAFEHEHTKANTRYRFMILARHDARFDRDLKEAMFSAQEGVDPDDHVILYTKRGLNQLGMRERCAMSGEFRWNEPDRNSIHWWSSDRLQVVPHKFYKAFKKLLTGPAALTGQVGPRWPHECWAELAPLVGGDDHLSFFEEDLFQVCKETLAHSQGHLMKLMKPLRNDSEILKESADDCPESRS